jgi:phage repressor protein C with HTH and peptisase S24 domain
MWVPWRYILASTLFPCFIFGAIYLIPVSSEENQLENYTSYFRGFYAYLDSSFEPVEVAGTSMAPVFREGDLLLVVPFPMENLRVGDVIIRESQGRLLAHRIYEISDYIWTKGDNMPAPDPTPVTGRNYRWLVVGALLTSSEGWRCA